MVCVIEAVMCEVMTSGCDYRCEAFERAELKLDTECVLSCLEQDVGHVCDIETVHVIVVSHIVVAVLLPDSPQELIQAGLVYLR